MTDPGGPALKPGRQLPILGVMARVSSARVAALGAAAALVCAAAAFAAGRLGTSALAAAGIVAGAGGLLTLGAVALTRRAEAVERGRAARLRELRELLHLAGSEAESGQLLLRYAQRLLPGTGAALLSTVESEQRLEPLLGERIAETPLAALALQRLSPGSCLAMRLGRPHERGPVGDAGDGLVSCEICGRFPGALACAPLRAGGRTLGALLLVAGERIPPAVRTQLHEAVGQAAPLFAIQRSLAVVERHAARDPLTGLPNRRAADETLGRLTAQAGRTVSPVAAVIIDLDRFRSVNDRFGHEQGDAALVHIGRALADGVRASDFVGRYGGEEFIVLAPDTDRLGASELAEKLRRDVEQLELPGVGRLTASFGVAALPEDALEGEMLMRRAGRALAIAKALGRNRVQGAQSTPATEG
jgi:diguanylate cyclase (GGDEF)-like protein